MYSHCTFRGQRVVISGQRFERCTFVNCELVFDGRLTQLVDCTFEGYTVAFDGPAAETLAFLTAMCRESPEFGMMLARTLGFVHEKAN